METQKRRTIGSENVESNQYITIAQTKDACTCRKHVSWALTCRGCWRCTNILQAHTLCVSQPKSRNCWSSSHTNTYMHIQPRLVICPYIGVELLTLSSSIFKSLAALTSACHFNTQVSPLPSTLHHSSSLDSFRFPHPLSALFNLKLPRCRVAFLPVSREGRVLLSFILIYLLCLGLLVSNLIILWFHQQLWTIAVNNVTKWNNDEISMKKRCFPII